jgi:hypothetical protein
MTVAERSVWPPRKFVLDLFRHSVYKMPSGSQKPALRGFRLFNWVQTPRSALSQARIRPI